VLPDRTTWKLACALARSGAYDNVVLVEYELRRRGLIKEVLTDNAFWREHITRRCHAARDGVVERAAATHRDPAILATGYHFSGSDI
jgi:hypothetical protein